MRKPWASILSIAGTLLGLAISGLSTAGQFGWIDVAIVRSFDINWPFILLLTGLALGIFSGTWLGFELWQRRPAARFRCMMYDELKSILSDIENERYQRIASQLTELEIVLGRVYKVPCPSEVFGVPPDKWKVFLNEWQVFLIGLVAYARVGDLKGARQFKTRMAKSKNKNDQT